nr:MAG TPA: hypothetical protein [Caudoviricetes sp.]
MKERIDYEKLLKFFKEITKELTYAEYEMLFNKLSRVYNQEKNSSTYSLRIDTTYIKDINDLQSI